MLICAHMHFSPHTVFRLMAACKAIHAELRHDNERWWSMFYAKVLGYQGGLQHSNFKHALVKLGATFPDQKQTLLQVVFSRHCHFCHKRFGHRMVPVFGMRACPAPCLRDNMVSNIVLSARYGINFSDFLLSPNNNSRMLVFHARQLMDRTILRQLTVDPYDHQHIIGAINYWGIVCFFLKADVEKWLAARLDDTAQKGRRKAARVLSAHLARCLVERQIRLVEGPSLVRRTVHHQHAMQRRQLYPALPPSYWLAGGAFWSVLGPITRALVRRPDHSEGSALRLKQALDLGWRRCKHYYHSYMQMPRV